VVQQIAEARTKYAPRNHPPLSKGSVAAISLFRDGTGVLQEKAGGPFFGDKRVCKFHLVDDYPFPMLPRNSS